MALQRLNIARMRLNLPALNALHYLCECRVGRSRNPYFLTLGSHQAVEKIDLGAAALEHVLPGRDTVTHPPLRCRAAAARALGCTRLWSGIVARPPGEHQPPVA